MSVLDDSIGSKVGSPDHLPHEVWVFCVADALEVWIELCCVRFMEVCQKGKEKSCFEGILFRVWRRDNLASQGVSIIYLDGLRQERRTITIEGNRSRRRKYAPGLNWLIPHTSTIASCRTWCLRFAERTSEAKITTI